MTDSIAVGISVIGFGVKRGLNFSFVLTIELTSDGTSGIKRYFLRWTFYKKYKVLAVYFNSLLL
jgi:hypothetical protein